LQRLLQVRVEQLQDPAPAVVVSGVFVVEADEITSAPKGPTVMRLMKLCPRSGAR
jgi:hypothetical protein